MTEFPALSTSLPISIPLFSRIQPPVSTTEVSGSSKNGTPPTKHHKAPSANDDDDENGGFVAPHIIVAKSYTSSSMVGRPASLKKASIAI
jgi:hypothetical protein